MKYPEGISLGRTLSGFVSGFGVIPLVRLSEGDEKVEIPHPRCRWMLVSGAESLKRKPKFKTEIFPRRAEPITGITYPQQRPRLIKIYREAERRSGRAPKGSPLFLIPSQLNNLSRASRNQWTESGEMRITSRRKTRSMAERVGWRQRPAHGEVNFGKKNKKTG
ncbi:hypothetical protein NPIL_419221 [Nephila pilipes]|uniref:Uncharacterized protein n=1 Tax=Nephila pilipes TaxID=299642 RepID=A0A8X6TG85_NEPPI|nr:hypothetical protein NPIL_419221 [Nephila pilipes]